MNDTPLLITPERLPELGITYTDTHLRRLEAKGRFPKRVQLSPRRHAYAHAEVMAWVRGCIEARDSAPTAA
jgi:predicted DNA-binding transcriptional regulator AlpA